MTDHSIANAISPLFILGLWLLSISFLRLLDVIWGVILMPWKFYATAAAIGCGMIVLFSP